MHFRRRRQRRLVALVAHDHVFKDERVHWLDARWTDERADEPIVNARLMKGVHAGQILDRVVEFKVDHANDALFSFFASPVILARRKLLNESHALQQFDLFLLGQLLSRPLNIGSQIEDLLLLSRRRARRVEWTTAARGSGIQVGERVEKVGMIAVVVRVPA